MIKFYLFDQLVMSIDEKLIKSLAEREAISLLWDRMCDIATKKYEEDMGILTKKEELWKDELYLKKRHDELFGECAKENGIEGVMMIAHWDELQKCADRKFIEEFSKEKLDLFKSLMFVERAVDKSVVDFLDLPEEEKIKYLYIIDEKGKKTVWI
ncbi:MAG: hypothetical protein MJ133_11980 [Lachnospiraceae bacterium]|nr:hypothetical protein [Lachnospiraceae bacterium]